mmetsp:Transcript_15592/g.31804  ORF Transcript_15592/g.31804 Transcript_15592/m.31804 type:complete len:241 (+) Transcript_15592:217-939(+)
MSSNSLPLALCMVMSRTGDMDLAVGDVWGSGCLALKSPSPERSPLSPCATWLMKRPMRSFCATMSHKAPSSASACFSLELRCPPPGANAGISCRHSLSRACRASGVPAVYSPEMKTSFHRETNLIDLATASATLSLPPAQVLSALSYMDRSLSSCTARTSSLYPPKCSTTTTKSLSSMRKPSLQPPRIWRILLDLGLSKRQSEDLVILGFEAEFTLEAAAYPSAMKGILVSANTSAITVI